MTRRTVRQSAEAEALREVQDIAREGDKGDWLRHPFTSQLYAMSEKDRETQLGALFNACHKSTDPAVLQAYYSLEAVRQVQKILTGGKG